MTASVKHASLNTRVMGYAEMKLRTIDKAQKSAEILNADCTLDSAEVSARVTTPARIRLPDFKGKPTPLDIVCTAGARQGRLVVEPYLVGGGAVGDGSAVGMIGAAIAQGIAQGRDKWTYSSGVLSALVPMNPTTTVAPVATAKIKPTAKTAAKTTAKAAK